MVWSLEEQPFLFQKEVVYLFSAWIMAEGLFCFKKLELEAQGPSQAPSNCLNLVEDIETQLLER